MNITIFLIALIALPSSIGFSLATAPTRVKDTRVAVDGKATFPVVPPPDAVSQNLTLTNYMRLPVEQYVLIPMPLGSSLTRIDDTNNKNAETETDNSISPKSLDDGTEFELVVPTITFFKLSLQPVVYASVQPQDNRVVIYSNNCILRGSPFIEKTQLNDRFDFSVNCTLTWNDSLSNDNNNQNDHVGDDNVDGDDSDSIGCSITATTCIDVDVDVPRPFSSIPKGLTERTGNAAMKISLKYIQSNFVDNLAKDYAKWAIDESYREYRASLSKDNVVEEDDVLVEA